MSTLPSTMPERIMLPAVPSGAGGNGGGAPTASEIYAMLRRRTLLIVVLFVLFSGIVVGGFIAWRTYFPGYRSECQIECISNIPEAELALEQTRLRQEEYERFVLTQALILKSPTILGEALKVNAVRETQWFRSLENKNPLLALTEQLSAAPIRGSNLLRVSMECRTRTDPAVIVNEVVRLWYDSVRRRSAEEFASRALEDARKEEKDLDLLIESKRNELKRLAARLPAGASQNPVNNITAQQVMQYGQQVAQLTLELAQLDKFREIYNDPNVAVTAEDRALVEQDPQVAELARAVFLLEQQLAADVKVFGPEHKVVKQLQGQLDAGADKLTALRTEKLQQLRNNNREAVNTAYANSQHALFLAQENLARAEAGLQDQDLLLFNYQNLLAEIDLDLAYKQRLSDYIKDRSRVIRQQTAVRVNIVQPAIEPLELSSPNLLLLPLGVFLALAMSVSIGLAVELLDKSLRTSQDVVRHLDVALLGAVPDTDDEEVPIEQVETAVRDAPRSMVAEAFRRIRTSLQFAAPAENQRLVLVTSPQPGDGKTTVACNLAMALAQGSRRVLLIDANFRRPHLHKLFRSTGGKGLSNLLIGEGTLAECAARTDLPALDVLFAGPMPPNPAELLGGDVGRRLFREAAEKYDQVIIDIAPVLLASDALVASSLVDGVVLVVRARENSRGVAKRACSMLTNVGAHLFGAVLNAAQVTRGGYFREQLRAYYDYQSEDDPSGPAQALPPRSPQPPSA